MSLNFHKIGVVGSGQMGAGIAQVMATYGTQVNVFDVKDEAIGRAKAGIEKSLTKLIEKGKITGDKESILNRLNFSTDIKDFKGCQLVIEAATENFEVKKKIFSQLEAVIGDDCVLATNTSSISITQLAATTARPEKFIGIHFMNPVPLMKLVEVIPGQLTNEKLVADVRKLISGVEKTMTVSKDYPGFIVNRILMPMINEAVFALYENIGTPEDIDQGMKLGTNQPMGPLELADFIGLDTCLAIMNVLHEGLGDSKYRPCPLLKNYVAAGLLGRKVGRGFYNYEK